LIDGVAKSMAEDFFKRFDAEMERQHPQAYAQAAADAAAIAGTDKATDGAGGSPLQNIPWWAWAAGAAVVVALAWKFA
jgi:type VI protein secretion system component VasF